MPYRNPVLRWLAANHPELVEPTPVPLRRRQIICNPGDPLTHLWFIECGLVSTLRPTSDGELVTVGVYGGGGRGFIGSYGLLYPPPETLFQMRIEIAGTAYRAPRAGVRATMERDPKLREMMQQNSWITHVAIMQMMTCTAKHDVEKRIARQLLLLRYMYGHDCLPLSGQTLANMVSCDRTYMIEKVAEWGGAVILPGSANRPIVIRDLAAVRERACGCFADLMAERDRARSNVDFR